MNEGERKWFFKDTDFAPRGAATEEQVAVLGLQCRYVDAFTFEIQSGSDANVWYEVEHDLVYIKNCGCMAGRHHRRCKHKVRGEVVLLRRNARLYEEKQERLQQERREKSTLNTGNEFKLER